MTQKDLNQFIGQTEIGATKASRDLTRALVILLEQDKVEGQQEWWSKGVAIMKDGFFQRLARFNVSKVTEKTFKRVLSSVEESGLRKADDALIDKSEAAVHLRKWLCAQLELWQVAFDTKEDNERLENAKKAYDEHLSKIEEARKELKDLRQVIQSDILSIKVA